MVSPVIIAAVAFVFCICVGVGIYFATKKDDSSTDSGSPGPAAGSPGPAFPQVVQLTDASFEAYSPGIAANGAWGGKSLTSTMPTYEQGAWSSTTAGGAYFNLKNDPWGGSDPADQSVYAVFQGISAIQQSVTVVPGGVYTVSWKERGRVGWPEGANNDLNVSLNGTSVYNETNITDTGAWVSKTSSPWTAPAGVTTAILKFYATNPLGGDHSLFIDNVSMSRTS